MKTDLLKMYSICVIMKTFRFCDDENGNIKMVICANEDFVQHKRKMQFVFFTIELLGLDKGVTYDIQTSDFTW